MRMNYNVFTRRISNTKKPFSDGWWIEIDLIAKEAKKRGFSCYDAKGKLGRTLEFIKWVQKNKKARSRFIDSPNSMLNGNLGLYTVECPYCKNKVKSYILLNEKSDHVCICQHCQNEWTYQTAEDCKRENESYMREAIGRFTKCKTSSKYLSQLLQNNKK